ncbi:hypothetical protein OTU49_014260, partial [Cherax quadricarinatus]
GTPTASRSGLNYIRTPGQILSLTSHLSFKSEDSNSTLNSHSVSDQSTSSVASIQQASLRNRSVSRFVLRENKRQCVYANDARSAVDGIGEAFHHFKDIQVNDTANKPVRWYSESDLSSDVSEREIGCKDYPGTPVSVSSHSQHSQRFFSYHTPARIPSVPSTPLQEFGQTPLRAPKSVRRGAQPSRSESRILGTPDYLAPELLLH